MRLVFLLALLSISLFSKNLNISSLAGEFTQTVKTPENTQIIYKGEFFFKENNQALWIYNHPVQKKIYFKENKIAILEPELEQITFSKIKENIDLSKILKNAIKTAPNTFNASFDETNFIILTKNDIPIIINYIDKLENNITINFINPNANIIINDDKFSIDFPSHYDIINQ